MAKRGGKREGAGRKSNALKLLEAGFICNAFSAEIQEIKWNQFLNSKDENIALKAAMYLTDRLYGKAPQSMDLQHNGELRIVVDVVRPVRGNKD